MVPPRELNPSDREAFASCLEHRMQEEKAGLNLQARVTELETRNVYLQSLVVELLNKNEQLRRQLTHQLAKADEF